MPEHGDTPVSEDAAADAHAERIVSGHDSDFKTIIGADPYPKDAKPTETPEAGSGDEGIQHQDASADEPSPDAGEQEAFDADESEWGLEPPQDEPAKDDGKDKPARKYAGEFDTPDDLEHAYQEAAQIIDRQGQYLDALMTEDENGNLRLKPEVVRALQQKGQATQDQELSLTDLSDDPEMQAIQESLEEQFGSEAPEAISKLVAKILSRQTAAQEAKQQAAEQKKAEKEASDRKFWAKVDEFQQRYPKQIERYGEQIKAFYDRFPPEMAREMIANDLLPIREVLFMVKGQKELPDLLKQVKEVTKREIMERSDIQRFDQGSSGVEHRSPEPRDYSERIVAAGRNSGFDDWLHGRT